MKILAIIKEIRDYELALTLWLFVKPVLQFNNLFNICRPGKQFVQDVVDKLSIDKTMHRVAVVHYSSRRKIRMEVDFEKDNRKETVLVGFR